MRMGFRLVVSLLLVLGIVLLSGCASIINKTQQDVSISSSPDRAEVRVMDRSGNLVFEGKTPADVRLRRKNEYDVVINMAGYQESRIHISKEISGAWFGNIICGGIIGLIVDYANGAAFKLEPDMIHVDLITASIDKGETQLYAVFRTLDAEGQMRSMVVPLIKETG